MKAEFINKIFADTAYVRMGGNYRLYNDMIKERQAKLATAQGGEKTALENEIKALQDGILKIVPSYEIVTFSSSLAIPCSNKR